MSDHPRLLAAALQSRPAYDAVRAAEEDFPDELKPVWQAIERFYATDPAAAACDPDVLKAYVAEGVSNPKHARSRSEAVARIAGLDVSAPNVRSLVLQTQLGRIADQAALALASRAPTEAVRTLWDQWATVAAELDDVGSEAAVNDWGAVLRRRLDPTQRLVVTPRALNERIGGGLLPGHNVTIFGLTESGKSALAISMACGFARRGHKVLYCGNEDPLPDLMTRAVGCSIGVDATRIAADPETAERHAKRQGIDNLLMVEMTPGSLGQIEALAKRHRPAVVVMDQMRNLAMAKSDSYVNGLDKLAQGIRNLGKRTGTITIGITQAADSARGKAVLDTGDIDHSNVGIPAAADLLIGVGVTDTLYRAGQRCLSLCKNKLTGRHDYFTVNLDGSTSRVTS